MPLVEAMEAGVPVVGVRAGATPETVGDAGMLVEPGDAEGFADALERAAFDESLRAHLIAADGEARATQFSCKRAGAPPWPSTGRSQPDFRVLSAPRTGDRTVL